MEVRWRRKLELWVKLARSIKGFVLLGWGIVNGRYWRTASQVHSSPAPSSGGSAGTISFPVTGAYSGGLTITGVYSGGLTSTQGSVTGITISGTFEDAGVRAGEIIAYRCWQLRDGLLYSAYRNDFVWPPKETVEGNPATVGEGVHGFKNRLDACSYLRVYEKGILHDLIIVSGTVELWGEVYEHARGYRASKACIHSIDRSPNYDAAELRKKYGLNRRKKKKEQK